MKDLRFDIALSCYIMLKLDYVSVLFYNWNQLQ